MQRGIHMAFSLHHLHPIEQAVKITHTEAEKEPVQNWLILAHNMLMYHWCHLHFQVVWENLPSFHIFSPPFPTCPRRDPSRRRKRSNALHAAANHRLANVPRGHTWPLDPVPKQVSEGVFKTWVIYGQAAETIWNPPKTDQTSERFKKQTTWWLAEPNLNREL